MTPFPLQLQLGRGLRPKNQNFVRVVLQLHAESPPGATTGIVDHSQYRHAISVGSGSSASEAQFKFHRASFRIGGAGGLTILDHAAFTLGTSDFAFMGWFRFDSTGTQMHMAGQCDNAGANTSLSFSLRKTSGDRIRGFCCSGSSVIGDITGSTAIAADTWYFVAYGREGTTFRLFVNDTSQGTATSSASVNDSSNPLGVGMLGAVTGSMTGYLDEVSFVVGSWVDIAALGPPVNPFGDW